jgi:hypothetical protein
LTAGLAVADLVGPPSDRNPLVGHVGQVDEEVVVSAPSRSVKTPCFVPPWLVPEHAHAADQHRHFGRGQAHQLGAVEHHLFGLTT